MASYTAEAAKTLGDWSYIAIAKHYQKIGKHETKVLQDKNPEELHQMRVGMRRLRSAIQGFHPALKLPKNAKEKTVGKVARVLGELRDLDVLKETLENQYYPFLPTEEQSLLKNALVALKKQRKKTSKKVKAILTDYPYEHLKKGFENWLDCPAFTSIADLDIPIILPDLLLPQISHLLLHPAWLLGVTIEDGRINFSHPEPLTQRDVETLLNTQGMILHDLRKEAKRVRYNMELFTQFYPETYQKYLDEIKDIQAVLGEIQDSFVLGEFLFQALEINLSRKMPTFMAKLSDIRGKKWQKWQTLQQIFLDGDHRQQFHQMLLNPSP